MDCTVLKDSNTPEEEKVWMDKARELSKGLAREFPRTTADQFYNLIRRSRETGRKYVKIGHEVDRQAYNRILQLPLFREGRYRSGVQVEQENVREYPYGELARRTIGFVRNNKSPVRNTHIGLEGKFDYELHGEEGREYLRETDHGTVRNSDSTLVRAVDGNDLRTTINIDYQEIADLALREQIEQEEDLEGACLVLMETRTGAIRAMVNLLREGGGHDGEFSEIQNLAIGRKGEPGSVFKTVTLTSLLNDGYVKSLEETLPPPTAASRAPRSATPTSPTTPGSTTPTESRYSKASRSRPTTCSRSWRSTTMRATAAATSPRSSSRTSTPSSWERSSTSTSTACSRPPSRAPRPATGPTPTLPR